MARSDGPRFSSRQEASWEWTANLAKSERPESDMITSVEKAQDSYINVAKRPRYSPGLL